MQNRVAIVGAGMAGLLACKYAAASGFTPIVFEATNQVGGLWNHTMETTRLQNHKLYFKFSDFDWPSSGDGMFPPANQVLEYLNSYAKHFDLLRYVKFNSKVMSVDYEGESEEEMQTWELWGGNGKAFGSKGKWKLQVFDTVIASTQEYEVEFLVLCIGRFSGLPNIPEFPEGSGPEIFSGKVLHSMDYSAMDNADALELIKGKRVVIVGTSKSAIDIAYECALANGNEIPCTMIQRTIPWMLPDLYPWGVGLGLLLFNRISEMLVHKPGEGLFYSILAILLSPLRWAISKFVESYLKWKLPLKKYNMIPKEPFIQHASSCKIMFLPANFYDRVEEGSIVLKRPKKLSFCKEGLILDEEKEKTLLADVVIFATGYKGDEKLRNMFSRPSFRDIVIGKCPTSVMPLYRQMIHPRIPRMVVIGYSESLSNIYTFEMKSKWLASFLDKAFALPSIKEMEKDVEEWGKYMKEYMVNGEYRRSCISSIHTWFNDGLCKDMGCNPRRKQGLIRDLLEPYMATDYVGIGLKSSSVVM